jgi:hypothetical protein
MHVPSWPAASGGQDARAGEPATFSPFRFAPGICDLARSRLEILKESAVKSNHGRLTDTLFEGKTESESAVTYLVIGVHYPRFRAAVNRYTGR